MPILRRPDWYIPDRDATPEPLALSRRAIMGGTGALLLAGRAIAAPANPAYTVDRPFTPEKDAASYNNFYEFGTSKDIASAAQRLPVAPWTVKLDGMVASEKTIGFDDLLKQVQLQDRAYRHRCVEGWSMTFPWTGFPLSNLVALAQPLASAKYLRFETLADPKVMPGMRISYFTWPYVEGVTMDEAKNDLAFVGTGLYGKPLLKQNGAPIRIVLPWKYGFKSAKSIVRVTFTDKRPTTFWEGIQPDEYGFWANVNPAVPHPRWSQATEEVIGTGQRIPTQIYNGYAAQVASLYAGLQNEPLYR